MAAGHIVAAQCVDVAASTDAFYSTALPGQTAGSPSFLSFFNKSASGWTQDTYQNGSLISSVPAPTPQFAACDTTQTFFDGMELGWAVATAMILVYVIRRPYR
jgi:hypothetical protein